MVENVKFKQIIAKIDFQQKENFLKILYPDAMVTHLLG